MASSTEIPIKKRGRQKKAVAVDAAAPGQAAERPRIKRQSMTRKEAQAALSTADARTRRSILRKFPQLANK